MWSSGNKSYTEEIIAYTSSLLKDGPVQEQEVHKVHDELLNCLRTLEKEIEKYDRTKTKQMNEIRMLSAQITELTDRVEKARLRENELAERVARWVEYLKEEKEKMLSRGSRLYATGTLSATISEDIEYNINMLMQMRDRVDKKLLEIKERKRDHKIQLKLLKTEMIQMHRELGKWDKKYDELKEATKRMEVSRGQLLERIKEQRQKETAVKLICVELDRKLHELCGTAATTAHHCKDYCYPGHGLNCQFSVTTTSASQEGTTFA
ncbi:hypothetical protein RB195_012633 [Necator americanus]|uniref:Uncharacterized protein n=1 Tax=Necator americanus TaxID=51031 RepID=A0ABR1DT03_NECAM